ncbi:MAG: L-glutamate gamma-semialdehyde dehydrogenase [Planctomycetes bacterium]|nr:L-glutamate gamma-semialdehyde dehydrogenase [Planctomycetota bacterium]
MSNAIYRVPPPENEPVFDYEPGSKARAGLQARLKSLMSEQIEIPVVVGGKEIFTGDTGTCSPPHDHKHIVGTYHKAGAKQVDEAAQAAGTALHDWSNMPWNERAAIFLRAAEMISTTHRSLMNAATMMIQSKTPHQSEIDAVAELADFYRFNPFYMHKLYEEQPLSPKGMWNQVEMRPLEGFVFAVTPFNFTSIAGNLPTAPALMGSTVIWKPASSTVYTGWVIMQILKEAGLPDGVINFVPGSGGQVGNPAMNHPDLAGVHFTGSTEVFQNMWGTVGRNIKKYKSYPRIVGETGGKNFVLCHPSADLEAVVTAIIRGGFEYQGQKCSAASRVYIPDSKWGQVKESLLAMADRIKVGDVADFSNFMGAVIDKPAFDSIVEYIRYAKDSNEAEIIHGGKWDDSKGYFIEPTIVVTGDPRFKLMEEEIFGPVVTIHVYPENKWEETIKIVDSTSPYALTGCVFANDRNVIAKARKALTHSAGNFYVNDKPTGAVVGQQPFGGGRASGTNDKAGSPLNLLRWVSQRTIKETLVPPRDFTYPYMKPE